MTDTASVIQYVENGEHVIAEVSAHQMPHQTDWVNIDGLDYKVYDVVHTVFPEVKRMLSSVFIWSPDPEATDATVDTLRDRAIAARAGERDVAQPSFGECGDAVQVIHDRNVIADVTVSALPETRGSKYEGIIVPGTSESFVVSSIGHAVEDAEFETGLFLFEVEEAEEGAQMADVGRNLYGQRDNARTKVLDNEGPDAYEELMDRVRAQNGGE